MTTALVTGATSGIGRAIAIALREIGHEVLALGRNAEALEALSRQYGIQPIEIDLADTGALAGAVGELAIDILVNNAGMMPPLANFCDLDGNEIDRAVTVNFSSALHVTRLLAPGMRERRRGHIVFTGSTAGHAPFANLAV